MYAASDLFGVACRTSHTLLSTAQHLNLITGTVTDLDISDGTVTDDATSMVRRSLTMSCPNVQGTWDALDTVGAQISVMQGIKYVDGATELLPMGVFILDSDSFGYGVAGTLDITAPDQWGKVQKNGLRPAERASIPSNTVWQEIQRLVEGAWSSAYPFPGWSLLDQSVSTRVGSLLYDAGQGGREAAIQQYLTANSLEVFFDRNGLGVLQPVPVLTDTSVPVITIVAGAGGQFVDGQRQRDRTGIYNAVEVTTSASDVTFPPVIVQNTTTGDPYSVNGPLGYQPRQISLPTLRNSQQAQAAGRTELAKGMGATKTLSLTTLQNSALDSHDVLLAILPKIDRTTARPSELHIADTITHPLRPDGTQTIATRSTRPASDGT